MRTLMSIAVGLLMVGAALAEPGTAELQYCLTNAPLVVAGRVVSLPQDHEYLAGWAGYSFFFQVTEVIKGHVPESNAIEVVVSGQAPSSPLLRRNASCVLFLKSVEKGTEWHAVDPASYIQPQTPTLVRRLKQLAAAPAEKRKGFLSSWFSRRKPPTDTPKADPPAEP